MKLALMNRASRGIGKTQAMHLAEAGLDAVGGAGAWLVTAGKGNEASGTRMEAQDKRGELGPLHGWSGE